MTPARHTISERVSEAAERGFVGRARELESLGATARPGFLVAFLHGPGGIGKSRLLRRVLSLADDDVRTVLLDCREIEPTPDGFLRAMAAALGSTTPDPALSDVVDLLGEGAPRTILALDTYERFGLLDTWLRQTLLPALPDSVVTILAGRDAPGAAWLTSPGWAGLTRVVRLSALDQAESIAMLRSRDLTELEAARVNRFARGHPLALELAAAALRSDPDLQIELGPPPAVIGQLLEALGAELPESVLATLEAASTARRVTEPILRSLLARSSVRGEYDALRRLPFVERTPEGLVIHDVVREVVARDLEERDPDAHARYRRRAWSYFEARGRTLTGERSWEVTADLIYLIQNPVLRAACFPVGAGEDAVEPAVPGDAAAIRAIVAAHESPGAAVLLGRWLDGRPDTFSVARGPDGAVAAVLQLGRFDQIDPGMLARDPVARAWRDHLAAVPPRPGDHVLVMRRWLGRESGEMLSPAVPACWPHRRACRASTR